MFYKYEIIKKDNEDILYLYLDLKYEFSNELIRNENDLPRRTINFINSNKINFKGKKVYLIVNDIIVKTVDISKVFPQEYNNYNNYSVDNYLVNIQLEDKSMFEISLRDYLLSILFYNFSYDIDIEVYKCISILFTTYAYKMMKEYSFIDICSNFGYYVDYSYYKSKYLDYNDILNKLNGVIDEVNSIFMMFDNEYILPFIHYSNCGKTIGNKNYPYLSSVKCIWDILSPYYVNYCDYSFSELYSKLNINIDSKNTVSIKFDNKTNRLIIDKYVFSFEELKLNLNLRSNNIYIIIYNKYIRFITIGLGNSYGLSIFSANEMAKNGAKYYNILNYFFPKVKLYKYIKELS